MKDVSINKIETLIDTLDENLYAVTIKDDKPSNSNSWTYEIVFKYQPGKTLNENSYYMLDQEQVKQHPNILDTNNQDPFIKNQIKKILKEIIFESKPFSLSVGTVWYTQNIHLNVNFKSKRAGDKYLKKIEKEINKLHDYLTSINTLLGTNAPPVPLMSGYYIGKKLSGFVAGTVSYSNLNINVP